MAIIVLLVLVVLWAAFFAWPLLKGRTSTSRTADSVGDFSFRLGVLGRTGGFANRRRSDPSAIPLGASNAQGLGHSVGRPLAGPVIAPELTRSQRRRREVLMILAAAVLVTLLIAVTMGNPVTWSLQLLVDSALVAYLVLLTRMQQREEEQRAKVRYLPTAARNQPSLALRRTASNRF